MVLLLRPGRLQEVSLLQRCYRDPLLTIANTPLVLAGTLFMTWVLAGVGFAVLEDVGLGDGLYWSVVTMTTTGYGDLSPATSSGRVLAGLLMVWSIFYLLPAAIYHVAERLIHDRDEWTHEEQVELRRTMHEIRTTLNHLASKETP